ncbi:MAG: SLBB domain-containing protein [Desulfobacterales bacterium]|jgi:polysaccharide export outer membrane protein|nr:SLBB domain-containing protein [Desulfobacterales bacterium]
MRKKNLKTPGQALILLFLAAVVGCASGQDEQMDKLQVDGYSVRSLRGQDTETLNEQLFAAANINTDPSDYLLGAGDLLQVTVFESEELNCQVRVSSRGHVTLPLLGQVDVKGLSAREAEIHIEDLYRERYLKDPHVSVFVEAHVSQRVTLLGQFKNPGTYDYPTKMRLIDVMALGGGMTDQAGRTAQVRRAPDADGEGGGTFLVDLDKMIREGSSELNIEINGGDMIFVPEAGMFFVDGAVRKPGAYHITRRTGLSEALSLAGGMAPYADPEKVILIRHLGDGERQVLELDIQDFEVQQTPVTDRDVILVKASKTGRVLHGLGVNIGIPGVAGFGYRDPVK